MTNSATFWTVLAVVLFPVLLVMGMFCVLMIGVNLVLFPAWTLVALAYVGGFTNEIERCRRLAHGTFTPPRRSRSSRPMQPAHA